MFKNIANNHYVDKIKLIQSKFTKNNFTTPLQILKFLIPQNKNKFKLPPPSVKDITNIIKKLKPSSAVGSDIINIRVCNISHRPNIFNSLLINIKTSSV